MDRKGARVGWQSWQSLLIVFIPSFLPTVIDPVPAAPGTKRTRLPEAEMRLMDATSRLALVKVTALQMLVVALLVEKEASQSDVNAIIRSIRLKAVSALVSSPVGGKEESRFIDDVKDEICALLDLADSTNGRGANTVW